ncbi:hypothetical protein [Microcoleus sp. bin48.metabat.b7b8b9.023]|uniref:hypothetical protein n=1 Tax=Microcoleus sp. bin48.metabat.b7b8b9.023 TaxID=2742710 RepID=UPI0025E0C8D7|nr:hypothetical protein [Microcoleus sp. bin48.metabat.b7b8b9.023]
MKISRSPKRAIGLHKLDFRFWLYMNTQLSLFENSPAVGTLYRVGDLLKLKRKTPHTAGLKKGDIVKIEGIHPLDGSCKFWNELTESWGYLYPGEFALLPANTIDSVSESITLVEVDTESNPSDDSVSESITLVEVDTESNPSDDSVSSNCKAISTYRPRGTARGGEYFRFSYRDGSKMRHIHIRGGNTDSPIAQAKVQEVRSLLAISVRPAEIVEMLRA